MSTFGRFWADRQNRNWSVTETATGTLLGVPGPGPDQDQESGVPPRGVTGPRPGDRAATEHSRGGGRTAKGACQQGRTIPIAGTHHPARGTGTGPEAGPVDPTGQTGNKKTANLRLGLVRASQIENLTCVTNLQDQC